jgi:hypothetical protein
MANKWINYVYNETDYRGGELSVAQKLADTANKDTDKCTLKIETIAAATRLSVRHVKRILHSLEADGFVSVRRFQGRGKQPEFTLQKVTSVTPFSDRAKAVKGDIRDAKKVTPETPIKEEKVTFVTVKGDICDIEKVTSVTVKGDIRDITYKDEPYEPLNQEPIQPLGVVARTENEMGISIDILTQERIQDVVTDFEDEWVEMVKNRMVGHHGSHRNFLLPKIGYWLTDYQNNLWRYRKDRGNGNGKHNGNGTASAAGDGGSTEDTARRIGARGTRVI